MAYFVAAYSICEPRIVEKLLNLARKIIIAFSYVQKKNSCDLYGGCFRVKVREVDSYSLEKR